MKLKEFKKKFEDLKKKGYIPSARKGPTGIGFTLETQLGLKENNIALPDLHEVELKAHRSDTTLFLASLLFMLSKKSKVGKH